MLGAGGAVSLADTFVSAVFPHGTGWTVEAYLFIASCGVFVIGAIAAVVAGIWWLHDLR